MKRFVILLFVIMASFSLVACQKTTTTTTTTPVVTERLNAPTNLQITNKTLQWDAVPNATSYDIYINDVFHSTKTTTSFDFSAVSGNQLVFRVVAKGNQILPSLHSASVAYVANAAQEAQSIYFYMQDFMPGASMEVANEMVRKGMTGTEFLALKTSMDTLMTDLTALESITDIHTAINPLVTGNYNFEALISGLLMTMELNTDNPLAQAIAEGGHEEVVLILVRLIDFIQSFQQALTPSILGQLDEFVESDIESITAQEIVVLRDEMVAIFESTLPTTADFVLLYELVATMVDSMGGSSVLVENIRSNATTLATANHMSIEFYLDYIDSLSLSFFQSFLDIMSDPISAEMKAVEWNILQIKSTKAFMDSHQTQIEEIKNLLPVAQQQLLFSQFQDSIAGILESLQVEQMVVNPLVDVIQTLTFAQMQALSQLDQEISQTILSYLVMTDGELLRLQAIAGGFYTTYDQYGNATYENSVTSATYLTYTSYYRAHEQASLRAATEGVNLLAEVLTSISESDLRILLDFVIATTPLTVLGMETSQDATPFQSALEDYLDSNLAVIHELLLAMVNQLKNNQVMNGIQNALNAVHNYQVGLWGPDYRTNYSRDQELEEFAVKIYLAGEIDEFMSVTNKTKVETLITNVFEELKKPDVAAFFEMEASEMNNLRDSFLDLLDLFVSEAGELKDFSFTSLTESQKDRLRNW